MKNLSLLLPVLVAFTPPATAQTVSQTRIDADANWVAHADIESLRSTQFGADLWRWMEAGEPARRLDAMRAVLRFDPRKDLFAVTSYGAGQQEDDGVLVLRGQFDVEHLVTLVRANRDYASTDHGKYQIHQWIDDKNRNAEKASGEGPRVSYGAFFSPQVLVLGSREEAVGRALRVLEGTLPATTLGDWLGETGDAFFVAGADLSAIQRVNPRAELLKNSNSAVFLMSEVGDSVAARFDLESENAARAAAMAKVAEGLIALWQMKSDAEPFETSLAASASVLAENDLVRIDFSVPRQEMLDHIEKKASKK